MKMLLYCTKQKPILSEVLYFYGDEDRYKYECISNTKKGNNYLEQMGVGETLNGKIVGECEFKVEWWDTSWSCMAFRECNGLEKSCLTKEQLYNYVRGKYEFYAIHIKNLVIYDKPKELSLCSFGIDKAPQNMCYAIKRIIKTINVDYTYPNGKIANPSVKINSFEKCVVISIRPEWLCKILNGEKTIEVRKKVLKEMM